MVRGYEDALVVVDLEWNFTADEFAAFQTFFEDELDNGAFPFYITFLDPDDSSYEVTTDYQFIEPDYQFSRSDNLFNVAAVAVLASSAIEQLEEPFVPGLCGVVIESSFLLDGGGNTFECYAEGDYSFNDMEPAGTGIQIVRNGNSQFYVYGETFEIFTDGNLVLGSPSVGSGLVQMYYGKNPLRQVYGDDFESYATTSLSDGTSGGTGLVNYYSGNG